MHDLATLRRLRGLSQSRLALKSGVAESRIAEAETGARPLSIEAATKAAPHLGVDAFSLYLDGAVRAIKQGVEEGSERPVKAATVARAIFAAIESGKLSPEQSRAARAAVEELIRLAEASSAKARTPTLANIIRDSGGAGPLNPPSREAEEHGELMSELDRDPYGRRNDVTEKALGRPPGSLGKRPKTGPIPPDQEQPGLDVTYKSAAEDGAWPPVEGQDGFGRRIDH